MGSSETEEQSLGWTHIRLGVSPRDAERAGSLLLELGATGLLESYPELDCSDGSGPIRSGDPREVAPPLPRAQGRIEVQAWLPAVGPEDVQAAEARTAQHLAQAGLVAELSVSLVPDEDWNARWRAHFRPVQLCSRVRVIPLGFEDEAPCSPPVKPLFIEPGMAFGSGTHPTTRGCAAFLDRILEEAAAPLSVIDVGTGTGVLALAASLLGGAPIWALDTDPEALKVARSNATANPKAGAIEWFDRGLDGLQLQPVDLVLANLTAPVLRALAPLLADLLKSGASLVLGGMLERQAPAVLEDFRSLGLRFVERRKEDGWIAAHLIRAAQEGKGSRP